MYPKQAKYCEIIFTSTSAVNRGRLADTETLIQIHAHIRYCTRMCVYIRIKNNSMPKDTVAIIRLINNNILINYPVDMSQHVMEILHKFMVLAAYLYSDVGLVRLLCTELQTHVCTNFHLDLYMP